MNQVKCKKCPQMIVWLPTKSGKQMPVDAQTVRENDTMYDAKVHVSHFATCPAARDFRKK